MGAKVTSNFSVEQWLSGGEWARVSSSNVAGIRYDLGGRQLFVEFKDGSVYGYFGVGASTARAMFEASSMGQFVHRRLKGKFSYRKLS